MVKPALITGVPDKVEAHPAELPQRKAKLQMERTGIVALMLGHCTYLCAPRRGGIAKAIGKIERASDKMGKNRLS